MKKLNKKGFTLAELLIVVAIIAVLVAIAVPLFVGALDNAQDARDKANIRAVRGAAVVYLLENSGDATIWTDVAKGNGSTKGNGWHVTAIISASGEINKLTVDPCADTTHTGFTDDGTCEATKGTDGKADGTYTVKLHLTATDIKDLESAVTD